MSQSTEVKTSGWLRYFRLTVRMVRMHLLTELEYRTNFLIKMVGMLANDVFLLGMWLIFFRRFASVNGWTTGDTLILFSLNLFLYSLFALTSYGLMDLSKHIAHGGLDYFLALPKNVLWHVSVSRVAIEGLGDFVFGLVMYFIASRSLPSPVLEFPLFLAVSVLAALILYNFTVIVQSLAFYFGNYEETAERWFWSTFGFMLYPQSFFSGWLKAVVVSVMPVFFLVGLPVRILRELDFRAVGLMAGFWLLTFCLSQFVFHRGLKRYESGNLINVRV